MDKQMYNVIAMYDRAEYFGKRLHKYLSDKTKETPNLAFTEKLLVDVNNVLDLILVKKNRLKVIMVSLIAEEHYVKDFDVDIIKEAKNEINTERFIIYRYLQNFDSEFMLAYALKFRLMDTPISDGETAKAINHYIKKVTKRFKGKTSPVDILINESIQYSPLLSWSTKMARENRTVWEGVNDFIPDIRILLNKEYNKYEDYDKLDKRIHILLYPIIEYCYKNSKLNYVEKRHIHCGVTDERKKQIEDEKAKVKAMKEEEHLNKWLNKAIQTHNNWFYDPECNGNKKPRGYERFIHERETDDILYVIMGAKHVTDSMPHRYISGYLTSDPEKPIAHSVKGIYTYKTAKEASIAIINFKKDGIIDMGTVVMI